VRPSGFLDFRALKHEYSCPFRSVKHESRGLPISAFSSLLMTLPIRKCHGFGAEQGAGCDHIKECPARGRAPCGEPLPHAAKREANYVS
jgi:hypothetical protein